MKLKFYNSLAKQEQEFIPIDPGHIRIYVCGPTVYARPHIGNARSTVIYDVLYRLLQEIYGKDKVTYVRNITDVDDKIIQAAKENNETIKSLTARTEKEFHEDMEELNVLRPTHEPKATENIPEIIRMIQQLISKDYAYIAEGHVLFRTGKYEKYGRLSNRSRKEMIAGARIEVAPYKEDAGDFVLWKPAEEGADSGNVFDSPWGKGRPGWHIECSAMSTKYLGETFDIHGGGADLMFPHHENEIAQSCCANFGSGYAKYWIHNGFLTVNGEKMSKSLGNVVTTRELLDKNIDGEVIRYALLTSHYRKPLDWNDKLISDAKKSMDYLYQAIDKADNKGVILNEKQETKEHHKFLEFLGDDLNTPACMEILHSVAKKFLLNAENIEYVYTLKHCGRLLGLFHKTATKWFKGDVHNEEEIENLITERLQAKQERDFTKADEIRDRLKAMQVILEDRPDGTTDWRHE